MAEECKCPPLGLPAWMGTFADLMSLLMCFFVLLLSFSEMDVLKFRQIAGSMKLAFGVQNLLEVKDIPKGTSIIAQEFRPGRPEPTPIEVIMQQTIDITQRTLDWQEGESERSGGSQRNSLTLNVGSETSEDLMQVYNIKRMSNTVKMMIEVLEREVDEGAIEIENLGQQLIIRILEKGAFPAGSAFLQPKFRSLVHKITSLVKDVPGEIRVSGHTDDSPLDSELYRSNWDLSAQRAVSVAQEMEKVAGFDPMRMRVEGFAGSMPLVPNDSPLNRSLNRRVEVSVMQGKPIESDQLSADLPIQPIKKY
ncbi:flagellar motor protein MotB [Candidatus Enterovibrio escicola]|uniref:Flagellar motor rotation protein MotB n=1 Tax=Candidatus Enterovibrio escicola TaxID=1927127 RepID=A0A2A5SZV9_9GAMM|nr:flagellar motor protein MotB [Candidatus Enterovibrio escacola]PCS21442.1 Flagellar motor rotation protein MotB [Candidatus Enterovibrio escacola]